MFVKVDAATPNQLKFMAAKAMALLRGKTYVNTEHGKFFIKGTNPQGRLRNFRVLTSPGLGMEMLKELQMDIASPVGDGLWMASTAVPRYTCASAKDLQEAICRCYIQAIIGQVVEIPEGT